MRWFKKINEFKSRLSAREGRLALGRQSLRRLLLVTGALLLCLVGIFIFQPRASAKPRNQVQSATNAQQPAANVTQVYNRQGATVKRKLNSIQATLPATPTLVAPATVAVRATPPAMPMPVSTQPPVAAAAGASTTVVVVSGPTAKLVVKPGGAVIRTLGINDVLTANGQSANGQWLAVQTADNNKGWVATDDVVVFDSQGLPVLASQALAVTPTAAPTPTTQITSTVVTPTTATTPPTGATAATSLHGPTAQVTLTSARLNVRAGPGTNYPVIASAAAGDLLGVQARNEANTWVQVTLPNGAGGFGWVSVAFVKLSRPVTTLPVSTATSSAPKPAGATGITASAPMLATASARVTSNQPSASQPAPAAQRTAPTGLSGHLVIESTWGGTFYLYNLATGVLRPLTGGFDPALSPDGSQVVFTRDGGDGGVYLINTDGSNEHRIYAGSSGLRSPMWSPDGQWIVFSEPSGSYKCYALGTNDTCASAKQIFYGKPAAKTPAAKAARDKVLQQYPREARPNFNLSLIDRNGGNYRNLAALDSAQDPAWSSAGIVYAGPAGLQQTAALTGSQSSLVTASNDVKAAVTAGKYMAPTWQLSGGRIVFQGNQNDHWELFSVNADGSGLTALTHPVTTLVAQLPSNVAPAWSPDGQHIVYLSNQGDDNSAGAWRVWVMNADGGNQHPLPINLPITYTFVGERMVNWGR